MFADDDVMWLQNIFVKFIYVYFRFTTVSQKQQKTLNRWISNS